MTCHMTIMTSIWSRSLQFGIARNSFGPGWPSALPQFLVRTDRKPLGWICWGQRLPTWQEIGQGTVGYRIRLGKWLCYACWLPCLMATEELTPLNHSNFHREKWWSLWLYMILIHWNWEHILFYKSRWYLLATARPVVTPLTGSSAL